MVLYGDCSDFLLLPQDTTRIEKELEFYDKTHRPQKTKEEFQYDDFLSPETIPTTSGIHEYHLPCVETLNDEVKPTTIQNLTPKTNLVDQFQACSNEIRNHFDILNVSDSSPKSTFQHKLECPVGILYKFLR